MSRKPPPTPRETVGESLIAKAREEYATDEIDIDELEKDIEYALKGDARHWQQPQYQVHRHFLCPWCGGDAPQSLRNFSWWCSLCGKNATDYPGWQADSKAEYEKITDE